MSSVLFFCTSVCVQYVFILCHLRATHDKCDKRVVEQQKHLHWFKHFFTIDFIPHRKGHYMLCTCEQATSSLSVCDLCVYVSVTPAVCVCVQVNKEAAER